MEAGQAPAETVPTFLLWLIYFGVPFVFIALRHGLVTCGQHEGVGTLPGILLGLGFCLGLSVLTTDGIKLFVGRPRPNYFALRALVDHAGSSMSSLKGKSIRSFPSGHSSMSMAGTAYVTLVCWGDLAHFSAARKGWRRSLLAYLSILPAFISVWVGVTRVRDYWHFQDDVTAGWAIGAICAAIAVRWVAFPENFWRGGKEGHHGSGRDVRALRDGGALALMMDSTRCDSPGDSSSSHEGGDLEGGAMVSGDRSQRAF